MPEYAGDHYDLEGISDSKGIAIGKDAFAIGELIQNLTMPADPLPPVDPVFAATRLAQLPSDAIPDVTALPPGSRIAFGANPLFTGREAELLQLAALLKQQRNAVVSAGIGGVGKTSLAAEFAHRYGQFFAGGVFWISCAIPDSIPAECVACGGAAGMRLPGFEMLKFDQQLQRVQAEWQSSLPRLLIFDNCEDTQLLRQYSPRSGACHVLITSRNPDWPASLGVHVLPLESLLRQDSIAMLRRFRPSLSDQYADLLANSMGDLPLALHLTGSFLGHYEHVSVPDYLKQLAQVALDHPAFQGRAAQDRPTGRVMNLARAFALSYDQLQADDQIDMLARQLLARASYYAPGEPFLHALLLASLPIAGDQPMAELDREDGLRRLLRLGLLEREDEHSLRMHRLLNTYVQRTVIDSEALIAVQHVFHSIADDTQHTRAEFERLQPFEPHLAWLVQQAQQPSVDAAHMQRYLGRIYAYSYRHELALESYGAALGLYRAVGAKLGEANVLVAMGDVQQFRDERDAALESYGAALGLYRVVGAKLGEANVLAAQSRLAFALQGKQASEQLIHDARSIYENIGARYNFAAESAKYAFVLLNAGYQAEARPYLLQAAQCFEELGLQEYGTMCRNAATTEDG